MDRINLVEMAIPETDGMRPYSSRDAGDFSAQPDSMVTPGGNLEKFKKRVFSAVKRAPTKMVRDLLADK